MAKSERITKQKTPWRWRWRSIKNWFYDKWMRLQGYKRYMFKMYDNSYTYIKTNELEEMVTMQEKEPVHELVGFMAEEEPRLPWYHSPESKRKLELDKGRQKALNTLRTGDDDAGLIRRSLS